ncbi:MAG TPA: hypothetical protein VFI37_01970 [Gaiellaceae bacterium]|nr:hypothetical protein [Gaiellaceae bacterium]
MDVRAPQLRLTLRNFSLGAFLALQQEVERGADVPFAFEAHPTVGAQALYEYRPLVRGFVEERAHLLRALPDARLAVEDLRREPSAAIFARAHAGAGPTEEQAVFRTVLLPLVISTAEASGGFDWHDDAFDRAYAELERSLFGQHRAYAAVAPLVGISAGEQVELGGGVRVRHMAAGELSGLWPEAQGLLPPEFGRAPDRLCVVELRADLPRGEAQPPDAPGELADAVTALRLATAAPVAAGPVLFERLDFRPLGIRPLLPIAGTQPPGEPSRLDGFRGGLARDLRERLPLADADRELAEALDRWELALFAEEPFRGGHLREALESLLGRGDGLWAAALRGSLLLGETARERATLLEKLRERPSRDHVRRALVETLAHGDRAALLAALDAALLGTGPRPASVYSRAA